MILVKAIAAYFKIHHITFNEKFIYHTIPKELIMDSVTYNNRLKNQAFEELII